MQQVTDTAEAGLRIFSAWRWQVVQGLTRPSLRRWFGPIADEARSGTACVTPETTLSQFILDLLLVGGGVAKHPGGFEGLPPQRGSAWCAGEVGPRQVVASRMNADFQPSTTLRHGASPRRRQMPVAVQHSTRCVSPMASVSQHSTCAQPLSWTRSWALSAGAEARLIASQSQPRSPAARRRGALAERRCSVASALRRWAGKGEQDDLGRTREVIAQVARQALHHEARAPLRVRLLANWPWRAPETEFSEQLLIASHSWPSSFFYTRRRVTVHGLLLVCWENGGGGFHPFSTQTLNLRA